MTERQPVVVVEAQHRYLGSRRCVGLGDLVGHDVVTASVQDQGWLGPALLLGDSLPQGLCLCITCRGFGLRAIAL